MIKLIICCVISLAALDQAGAANLTMKYFTTKTDHYGLAQGETFQMRYLIDDSNFLDKSNHGKPRPILFYAGNEGESGEDRHGRSD